MKVELSLTILMLLSGTGAGMVVLSAIAGWVDFSNKQSTYKEISKLGAYVALPVTLLGLLVSPLHLQRPQLFLTGIKHIASSWLSREGAAGIVLVILMVIYVYLWSRENSDQGGKSTARFIFGLLAAIGAVVLVFNQSMIYATTKSIPSWNATTTILLFFTSAAAMGTLLLSTVLVIRYRIAKSEADKDAIKACLGPLAGVAMLAVIAVAIVGGLRWLNLSLAPSPAAAKSLELLTGSLMGMSLARAIVGLLIPVIVLAYAWKQVKTRPQLAYNLLVVSFVLVVAGEALGRVLFWLSAVHVWI